MHMREKQIEEKPDLIKNWRFWAGIIFLLVFLVVSTGQGELFQGALKAKPVMTPTKTVISPAGQTAMKPAAGIKTTALTKQPMATIAQPPKTQTVMNTIAPYKYKDKSASVQEMPNPVFTYGPCDSYDYGGMHHKQYCFDQDFSIFKELQQIIPPNYPVYHIYISIKNPDIINILEAYKPDMEANKEGVEPPTYPVAYSGVFDLTKRFLPAKFHFKDGDVEDVQVTFIKNGYKTEILLTGVPDDLHGLNILAPYKEDAGSKNGDSYTAGVSQGSSAVAWTGDWFSNLSSVEIKLKSNYVLWLNNIDGSMAVQRSYTNYGDFNCACNGTGPQKCCGINPLQDTYGICGDSTTNFCSSSTQGQGSVSGSS